MNEMTSPPTSQPKQWYRFLVGVTWNDGDFSSWNGHSPLRLPPPARLSCRCSPTISSIFDRSRTSAMSAARIRPRPATTPAPAGPSARPCRGRRAAGYRGGGRVPPADHQLEPEEEDLVGQRQGVLRRQRRPPRPAAAPTALSDPATAREVPVGAPPQRGAAQLDRRALEVQRPGGTPEPGRPGP